MKEINFNFCAALGLISFFGFAAFEALEKLAYSILTVWLTVSKASWEHKITHLDFFAVQLGFLILTAVFFGLSILSLIKNNSKG